MVKSVIDLRFGEQLLPERVHQPTLHGRALVVATRQTRARAVDQHLAHAARLGGSAVCRVERPAADDPQLGTHGPDRLPLRDTYPIAESLHVLLAARAGARPSLGR